MHPAVLATSATQVGAALGPADLLAAFFAGRSPHTIAAYRGDLDDFRVFIGAETVEAAAARLLGGTNGEANALALAWQARLIEQGRSPATVNRKLSALRALVALGRTLGFIVWRIDIRSLRTEAYRDTRGPQRKGVVAMLTVAAAQADRRKALRDIALLRLLFDIALRRGEACNLDLEDVDLAGSRILVVGKGRREKVPITMPEPTCAALAAWIAQRGREAGPVFMALDPRTAGRPLQRLTGAGAWYIVKSIGAAAGLKTRPHALRHSAITAALDATGGNVRSVQRFSRHADVRTLLIYDDAREDMGGKIAAIVAV